MTTEQFWLSAWSWSPLVLVACVLAVVAYGLAFGFHYTRRVWALAAALVVFLFALLSPLATLSDGYLFSAHMTQHILLQLVVPPLLLLSLPPFPRPASFRQGRWRWVDRLLGSAVLAWFLGLGAMWVWHERTLSTASITMPWVHALEVVSLVVLGSMFWWPIVGPWPEHHVNPLLGVVYLFSACTGCTILGILITFAPVGVCPVYLHPADPLGILPMVRNTWGFTPAKDQQLGGLLMWVPACMVYLSGVMGMLARWYRGEYVPNPSAVTPMAAMGGAKY